MKLDYTALTDCTSDLFQLLNTIKWEAAKLQEASKNVERSRLWLVSAIQDGITENIKDTIEEVKAELKNSQDRATIATQHLDDFLKLL